MRRKNAKILRRTLRYPIATYAPVRHVGCRGSGAMPPGSAGFNLRKTDCYAAKDRDPLHPTAAANEMQLIALLNRSSTNRPVGAD